MKSELPPVVNLFKLFVTVILWHSLFSCIELKREAVLPFRYYYMVLLFFHGMLFFHVTFIVVLWSCNGEHLCFGRSIYSPPFAWLYFYTFILALCQQAGAVNHAGNWLLLTLLWAVCPIKCHCPVFLVYFAPSRHGTGSDLSSDTPQNKYTLIVDHC